MTITQKRNSLVILDNGLEEIQSKMSSDLSVCSDVAESVTEGASKEGETVSRRGFLKILGTASAATTAVACAPDKRHDIFPHVKGQNGSIPGEPVWYKSTCTECSAGCGTMVKSVDGRTIKVEGNKEHPINRGGLCALGQASLQHLYDPDRVRQPLKRTLDRRGKPQFIPISWDEVIGEVGQALKKTDKKHVSLLGTLSTSSVDLFSLLSEKVGVRPVYADISEPVALAEANLAVFGEYGVPKYKFENADFILNFGADFLETWISPCEFARGWSRAKRADPPLMYVHFEPRLSLTGANADLWRNITPGSELAIVRAIISRILEENPSAKSLLTVDIPDTSTDDASKISGVNKNDIERVVQLLLKAKSPLIIAGGVAAATADPLALLVAVQVLNRIVGGVGKTVFPNETREVFSSQTQFAELVNDLNDEKIGVMFTHGGNQAFTCAGEFQFGIAARKSELTVALSSHLDETTSLADFILPVHTGLESWGYHRSSVDSISTIQPSMAPVFDTRDVGDILLQLASATGKDLAPQKTMKDFVFAQFSPDLVVSSNSTQEADIFKSWVKILATGGIFGEAARKSKIGSNYRAKVDVPSAESLRARVSVATEQFSQLFVTEEKNELLLYPYPSIKTFDGRSANRPWLQELPDPITQLVWDTWAELHPLTAKELGVEQGDLINLRTTFGEVRVPLYITPYVTPNIVAVPTGQGHEAYGRFAQAVGNGNVFSLINKSVSGSSESAPLLNTKVKVFRGSGSHTLVSTTGSRSQEDRGLAKTKLIPPPGEKLHSHDHKGHDGGHHHHGPVKQMYHQREHPVYRWGMSIDLNACTGCSACVVACYAENNIPVVGKEMNAMGREMSWLRIERYIDSEPDEELQVSYLPMLCQHCNNAPCEPVCPVYATYHNEEGLNAMVYNRCVGTRYCSNNCSYKVRRFNWVDIEFPEPLSWQLNPYVTKRTGGVMEKCTFCVQRIHEAQDRAKDEGRFVMDGEIQPACVQSCPTEAIVFGNLNDPNSGVSKAHAASGAYKVLDPFINTQPAVAYIERKKYQLT
jgi:anaerobic selenocysteine-containing dehydrogenase/Fe-S-cluster-containing dehydrogenase component